MKQDSTPDISSREPRRKEGIEKTPTSWWLLHGSLGLLWWMTALMISSRQHHVLQYYVSAGLPWWGELLTASIGAMAASALGILFWVWQHHVSLRSARGKNMRRWTWSHTWIAVSSLPFAWSIARDFGYVQSNMFEPIWLATCTGLSFYTIPNADAPLQIPHRWFWVTIVSTLATFSWFWFQSHQYASDFMLGFNDYAHFAQRVANTASGRGFLMETPVLPPYWDHFNPALLVYVPVWWVWPSEEWFFFIQAACLASGGWIVPKIATKLGCREFDACCWGLVWLLHPSVSQMNVAYTYGWHPISLAIPILLWLIYRSLRVEKPTLLASSIDFLLIVVACCVEESVIVVLCLWAGVRWLRAVVNAIFKRDQESILDGGYTPRFWIALSVLLAILFVVVYRYSGLAPFQTARFAELGGNAVEIVLSPILRPSLFWGKLFEYRSWIFVACLCLPFLPWKTWRSVWCWLPTVPPLLVLLVWNHVPAKSLAFQYPTTLLPPFIVAAIMASRSVPIGQEPNPKSRMPSSGTRFALAAMVTSWMLTLYVGQMPWSSPTIEEVKYQTYRPEMVLRRQANQVDGKWLHDQIASIRKRGAEVLATGRIASHLIGCSDVETVGQFHERRSRLETLQPSGEHVLLRYDTILLDRNESFQQSPSQTLQIEEEAKSNGFVTEAEAYGIVHLRRRASP